MRIIAFALGGAIFGGIMGRHVLPRLFHEEWKRHMVFSGFILLLAVLAAIFRL
jgi:hypothetical protein